MINVAIVGYGNLGRGVEIALKNNSDMNLVGIYTRRDPELVKTLGGLVFSYDDLLSGKHEIDVCILCGGSAHDLPVQTPQIAQFYNVVDSYDNHDLIPEHFDRVNHMSEMNNHCAIVSCGWDPGIFSVQRLIGEAILPQGTTTTFWGEGVSQGHSDALRRIEGVLDAVQYTIPNEKIIEHLRNHETMTLTPRDKHVRECYVVLKEGYDQEKIRQEIVNMPHYFADYDTEVKFISLEKLKMDHEAMPHGGLVLRQGNTSKEFSHVMEYKLDLESNPEFTAAALVAYARGCARLSREKDYGAKSVLDIAPKYLSWKTNEQLRKQIL